MRLVQWCRSLPGWVWDGLGAVALAAISLVPALRSYGLELGELSSRPGDPLHVVLILVQTLPLAARRIAPGWVLGVVGLAFALDQCLGYPASPAGLGMLFALYSAAAHLRRRRGLAIAVSVVAYVALAVALTWLGSREQPWDFATFALVLVAAWGIGDVVRIQVAAARTRADQAAHDAVSDERARLARELHDVVSHHVTGMVVQADSAAFLLPADETAVRAQLESIAAGGRSALADLRQLLDVLGPEGAATSPAIGDLHDLIADAQRSGQPVVLHENGDPVGTDELRLAVYRIVQEGLTNALKHAAGASTQVRVDWDRSEVRTRLVTRAAGRASHGPVAPGSGRGLAGLAERVRRLDGRLRADAEPDGAFVLEAVIPVTVADATLRGGTR
ncbi:sensor histidine kinase [Rathayibacter sp. CAU 1779]